MIWMQSIEWQRPPHEESPSPPTATASEESCHMSPEDKTFGGPALKLVKKKSFAVL